jgi:hypothetical protein
MWFVPTYWGYRKADCDCCSDSAGVLWVCRLLRGALSVQITALAVLNGECIDDALGFALGFQVFGTW